MIHPFLPLRVVLAYQPLTEARGAAKVARSPRGFLAAYQHAKGKPSRLSDAWIAEREGFIARHMAEMRLREKTVWNADGSPTNRHLALITWAYSPEAEDL